MDAGLKWIVRGMVVLFAGLTVWVGFWAVFAGPGLYQHPKNPRLGRAMSQIDRGGIYARQGETLSVTRRIDQTLIREFTGPDSLAHVVGYTHARFGLAGLEAHYNRELLGIQPGTISPGADRLLPFYPRAGLDLVTTLDLRLQQIAAEALGNRNGAIVAIDPQTGDVLVMVSVPTFDPSRLDEVFSNPAHVDSPFFNRATQGQYPPGSAFKPVIMAAALESGTVIPTEVFDDLGSVNIGGRAFRNVGHQPLGQIGLDDALALSSNVVFATMATQMSPQTIWEIASRLGFGQRPIKRLAASPGFVPPVDRLSDERERAAVGIGQGTLLVTPIQMAVMAATVASGGLKPSVTLVDALVTADGKKLTVPRQLPTRVITPGTAALVKTAMERGVKVGTATGAGSAGLNIAGKTGTAENGTGHDHAWFVGFAPVDHPRLAVAIVVEHAGFGGEHAAPIAHALFTAFLSQDDDGSGR